MELSAATMMPTSSRGPSYDTLSHSDDCVTAPAVRAASCSGRRLVRATNRESSAPRRVTKSPETMSARARSPVRVLWVLMRECRLEHRHHGARVAKRHRGHAVRAIAHLERIEGSNRGGGSEVLLVGGNVLEVEIRVREHLAVGKTNQENGAGTLAGAAGLQVLARGLGQVAGAGAGGRAQGGGEGLRFAQQCPVEIGPQLSVEHDVAQGGNQSDTYRDRDR